MPSYKLMYFNGRARAEPIRLIFAQGGVQYEDFRIEREDWPKYKPTMPFGTIPVLEEDGKVLSGSIAIERYLAGKFGLTGKDYWEAALCDMYVEGIVDTNSKVFDHMPVWIFEKDQEKRKAVWEKVETEHVGACLERYEKFLGSCQSGFLVGDGATWADLLAFNFLSFWQEISPPVLEKFPKLREFHAKIGNLPNVKKWLETRPKTPF